MTPSERDRLVREAVRVASRGSRTRRGQLSQHLGAIFGDLGELAGIILDVMGSGRKVTNRDVTRAIELLQSQGFGVSPAPQPPQPPGPVESPPVQGVPTVPSVRRTGPTGRTAGDTEIPIEVLPARIGGRYRPGHYPDGLQGELSPIIFVPESSNVHSFFYDYAEGVLYVRFREGDVIGTRKSKSVCTGKEYSMSIKDNSPGPLYSYGGRKRRIPPELYNSMAAAASKGKFVWTELRVCGSVYQHKYPYTLTDVPAGGNVPRKATRPPMGTPTPEGQPPLRPGQGDRPRATFRVRTVPTVGTGRRGFRTSTLPQGYA